MSGAGRRVGNLLGWSVVPALAGMQLVDLRRDLHGQPAMVSTYLLGFTAVTLVGLVFVVARWRSFSRAGRLAGVAFGALLAYALVRALGVALPVVQQRPTTRPMLVVPLLTAAVTALAAVGCMAAVDARERHRRLWWAAWAMVAVALVQWPRAVASNRSVRLASAMGGSAVLHVALLTAAGLFLGCAVAGWRRRASSVGTALSAAAVLATGSRAGLVSLALFAALVTLWALGRGAGRRAVAAVLGLGVLTAGVVAAVPSLRRLVNFSEPGRARNLETALEVWSQDWGTRLLGVGSGRLWPWYAFDIRAIPSPGAGLVRTEWGLALTSPHSVFLGVLVELGVLGMLLWLVVCGALVWQLVRLWRGDDPIRTLTTMALCATLAAFVLDTYLLKNFGVSFWWWLVLFGVAASSTTGARDATEVEPVTA